MTKYRATIKQTEWFEVTFDADDDDADLVAAASEAFGVNDAESLDLNVQIEDVQRMED